MPRQRKPKHPSIVALGSTIRARRILLNLSRANLAYDVKISEASLAGYERGERSPRPDVLDAIARALQTTASELRVSADKIHSHGGFSEAQSHFSFSGSDNDPVKILAVRAQAALTELIDFALRHSRPSES